MGLVVAGATTVLVIRHQTQANRRDAVLYQVAQLQAENQLLSNYLAQVQQEPSPRLPAALGQTALSTPAATVELQATNVYARFAEDPPKLTVEQVEAYLKEHGRKAANLLAAYRTSGDPGLLEEAMQNYPDDPRVAFEAVFKRDLSPEERRQWLNAFEQAVPDNALANYLSASEYFKVGQPDEAIRELVAASGKQAFQDYTLDRRQDDEEAYLAAGYPTAAAKMIASGQVTLPQLSELKQLGLQMVDLSNSYRKAGDEASAQSVLQMAVSLGQRYGAGDCGISHLVGLVIERNALSAMEPGSHYGGAGQTVEERINQINQQKTEINSLFKQGNSLLETMSDRDWISYIDRDKAYGEEAAMRWLISKQGGEKGN